MGNDSPRLKYQYGDWSHVVAISFAGGIAGSMQHVASHYTEVLGKENSFFSTVSRGKNDSEKIRFFRRNVLQKLPVAPTFRSVITAFPPTAIGFVAFEYGKEVSTMPKEET